MAAVCHVMLSIVYLVIKCTLFIINFFAKKKKRWLPKKKSGMVTTALNKVKRRGYMVTN